MILTTALLRLDPPATSAASPRWRRWLEGVTLWLAVLLMLFVHPLYAEADTRVSSDAGELRLYDDQGRHQDSALVLDSHVQVQVRGLIAEVRLHRRFRNVSGAWREGVFVFPLPEQATVHGLDMTVGERVIRGEVQPRAQARQAYQQARDSGRQAAAVEQQRPNLFTARVANIPPGGEVDLELRFQQRVRYTQGTFELRLPTTLTPRYMPGRPTGNEAPWQWQGGWARGTTAVPDAGAISPPTVAPSELPPGSHRVDIEVSLAAGVPLASVVSPSHPLDIRMDGTQALLRPAEGPVLMDRDFVLRWQPVPGRQPTAAVFHERFDGEDYLMAMVVPGNLEVPPLPRELMFVIDTSGSMAGESIRQARKALARGLDTLGRQDRFNIIQFNDRPSALFEHPVVADRDHLDRARRYLDRLQAEGGTEMAPALSRALSADSASGADRVRQVVFITDGAVGNEAALFQQIRQQLGDRRLFTVGIGSAPNLHFMREAARWGRGTYTAVAGPSDLEAPLQRLFAAMAAPVLTHLVADWPTPAAEAYPGRPGDLFEGEPLVQVVRGVPPRGRLLLSGSGPGGEPWQVAVDLSQAVPGVGLHRLWARARIDSLLDQARIEGVAPDQAAIVQLAMAHRLASPYTSFVAVDRTPVRAPQQPLLRTAVPTLVPAGSSAGMLRYPQTATVAPLLIALGTLGLMFAVALVLLQRRVGA